MDKARYSNRELDEFFNRADERADAFHNKLMQRMDVFESNTSASLFNIEKQTTKTNGSVASLKLWRAYITGGLAVVILVVLPVLGWVLIEVVNNSAKIGVVQSQLR